MCAVDHEALKRDAERWQSLRFVGVQDAGDGERLELRDCGACKSTLAIELPSQETA